MKKIILAYPQESSDSHILYDENGKMIYGWEEGDDITFAIRALLNKLNISLEIATIREIDGEYPETIQRI